MPGGVTAVNFDVEYSLAIDDLDDQVVYRLVVQ